MEQLKKLEEGNVNKFDFTRLEINYIMTYANFNKEQEEIFKRLTSREGRQSIVKIALEMCMSESTVKRRIKQIKNKIKRLPF